MSQLSGPQRRPSGIYAVLASSSPAPPPAQNSGGTSQTDSCPPQGNSTRPAIEQSPETGQRSPEHIHLRAKARPPASRRTGEGADPQGGNTPPASNPENSGARPAVENAIRSERPQVFASNCTGYCHAYQPMMATVVITRQHKQQHQLLRQSHLAHCHSAALYLKTPTNKGRATPPIVHKQPSAHQHLKHQAFHT